MSAPRTTSLVFLDTEFTDFIDCEMISIGLVSNDNTQRFYAERNDFNIGKCNEWVLGNILPLLSLPFASKMNRTSLRKGLWQWFDALPYEVIVAFDYQTDWDLLLDILLDDGEDELPRAIIGAKNISFIQREPLVTETMEKYFVAHPPRHHALIDALALREGWLAWERQGVA